MGWLNNIFGNNVTTVEDYIETNKHPVMFRKIKYVNPTRKFPHEGQKKEYNSFDDMLIDFPSFHIHKYQLDNSKNLNVTTGYFFLFRGYYYNAKSIEDSLSKEIGMLKTDDWYRNDAKQTIILIDKNKLDKKFKNSECFLIECDQNMYINYTSIKHKGVVSAKVNIRHNRYSVISKDFLMKPITFGNNIALLDIDRQNYKMFDVYHGYMINTDDISKLYGETYIKSLEPLQKIVNIEFDILKIEEIDVDNYLSGFKIKSRKLKLEKLNNLK